MIIRVSKKPEIQFRFRKAPDQAYVSAWLSVWVAARNKHFDQKGQFEVRNFWDEQTIRRLEDLSVRSEMLSQAVEESTRSRPTLPAIEQLKDLQRSGYDGRVVELVAPLRTWAEKHESAKNASAEAYNELRSLYAEMVHQRSDLPEKLLTSVIPLKCEEADERDYALYRSAVWRSDRDLTPDQWQVLVERFLERDDAELVAALSSLTLGESGLTRERIPPEVRRAVWIRDQGKCARCGSRERLEYDHIIPVSRGGSNTERNIELLCEFHNRAKSNTIS